MRLPALAIPVCVLLLAGCPRYEPSKTAVNTPPPTPAATPAPADATPQSPPRPVLGEVTSNDGSYVVRVVGAAAGDEPVPLNESFDISVQVFDGDGTANPAEDVTIEVDGRMPHHHHGMNQVPVIRETGPGRFDVEGMLFHMPGYWEIHVDVTRGEVTERAQIEVELE